MVRSRCRCLDSNQLLGVNWVVSFSAQLVGHSSVQTNTRQGFIAFETRSEQTAPSGVATAESAEFFLPTSKYKALVWLSDKGFVKINVRDIDSTGFSGGTNYAFGECGDAARGWYINFHLTRGEEQAKKSKNRQGHSLHI